MFRRCEDCGRVYDDIHRWTICPHRHLDENPRPIAAESSNMSDQCQAQPSKAPHPAIQAILQFFAYSHLPQHLQEVSRPFGELANKIADGPQNAEATVAIRKLLESKDAAVRAVLFKT